MTHSIALRDNRVEESSPDKIETDLHLYYDLFYEEYTFYIKVFRFLFDDFKVVSLDIDLIINYREYRSKYSLKELIIAHDNGYSTTFERRPINENLIISGEELNPGVRIDLDWRF